MNKVAFTRNLSVQLSAQCVLVGDAPGHLVGRSMCAVVHFCIQLNLFAKRTFTLAGRSNRGKTDKTSKPLGTAAFMSTEAFKGKITPAMDGMHTCRFAHLSLL